MSIQISVYKTKDQNINLKSLKQGRVKTGTLKVKNKLRRTLVPMDSSFPGSPEVLIHVVTCTVSAARNWSSLPECWDMQQEIAELHVNLAIWPQLFNALLEGIWRLLSCFPMKSGPEKKSTQLGRRGPQRHVRCIALTRKTDVSEAASPLLDVEEAPVYEAIAHSTFFFRNKSDS